MQKPNSKTYSDLCSCCSFFKLFWGRGYEYQKIRGELWRSVFSGSGFEFRFRTPRVEVHYSYSLPIHFGQQNFWGAISLNIVWQNQNRVFQSYYINAIYSIQNKRVKYVFYIHFSLIIYMLFFARSQLSMKYWKSGRQIKQCANYGCCLIFFLSAVAPEASDHSYSYSLAFLQV